MTKTVDWDTAGITITRTKEHNSLSGTTFHKYTFKRSHDWYGEQTYRVTVQVKSRHAGINLTAGESLVKALEILEKSHDWTIINKPTRVKGTK